ncbi:hypothetical protein [Photobacterium leiognathi]|uniref:hypothetical protein n=1 Tax=Photobacterium leiognathi TaxID=553611 RepID=UPI002980B546|nr:hypothetical protein [Photobacterium leiognathi]
MNMNIQDLCLIEASGTFLCEHLDDDIIQSETDILTHIEMNKCQFVENECNEAVFNMITDLAESLERFLNEAIRNNIDVVNQSDKQMQSLFKVTVQIIAGEHEKSTTTFVQASCLRLAVDYAIYLESHDPENLDWSEDKFVLEQNGEFAYQASAEKVKHNDIGTLERYFSIYRCDETELNNSGNYVSSQ